MVAKLSQQLRRRPIRSVLLSIAVVVALMTATDRAVDEVRWRLFRWRCESVAATPAEGAVTPVSWAFPFADGSFEVSATVFDSELGAARRLPAQMAFAFRDGRRARYARVLVQAQARSRFVSELAASLRAHRDRLALDDDAYLELIASCVQALPYERGSRSTQMPVEVGVERRGICTDKSVLLAAVLLHEGYDTGIWSLEAKNHVAVGVRSDAAGFAGTDYAFVESTVPSFIGQCAPGYRAAGPVVETPRLIPLGGRTAYSAGHEVAYILSTLEGARLKRRALEKHASFERGLAQRWDAQYWSAVRDREWATHVIERLTGSTHDRAGAYEWLTRCGASTAVGTRGG